MSDVIPTAPLGETKAAMRLLMMHLLIIESADEEDVLAQNLVEIRQTTIVSFLNQHAFNIAYFDPTFRDALIASDILLRDGVGIEIGLKLLGNRPGRNLNGTDFIPKVLRAAKGLKIAVYGTKEPWLQRSARIISSEGSNLVAVLDGFRCTNEYLESFQATDPDIVLLGMGMPKQEKLASNLKKMSSRPCLILNGGAILDFYAGRFVRAPLLVREAKLEWVYRMFMEPKRLHKRYVLGGVQYVRRLLELALD